MPHCFVKSLDSTNLDVGRSVERVASRRYVAVRPIAGICYPGIQWQRTGLARRTSWTQSDMALPDTIKRRTCFVLDAKLWRRLSLHSGVFVV